MTINQQHDIPTAVHRTLSLRDHKRSRENLIQYKPFTGIEILSFSSEDDFSHIIYSKLNKSFSRKGKLYIFHGVDNIKIVESENFKKLNSKIHIEYDSLTEKKSEFLEVAQSMSEELSQLNFSDVIIEFVNNEFIQFTFIFKDRKILIIDKFLSPKSKGLSNCQVFFSFFIERKLISSNVVEFSDFINKFQAYIQE